MKRRSLVLVTVDCLRADRLGFHAGTRPVTPFLDSLAGSSVVFSEAIVAGAPTYFSFPAIMASRYPLGLGREVLGIAPGESTIATALRQSGYETAAWIAGNPYLSPRFGYDQGFCRFRDFLDSRDAAVPGDLPKQDRGSGSLLNRSLERLTRRTKITAAAYDELYFRYCQWRSARENVSMDQLRRYPAADVVMNEACAWMKEMGERPFFLWIHLMDPHHPYYPPEEALEALGISDMSPERARFLNSFWNRGDIGASRLQHHRAEVMSLYDAGVRWVDIQISRLVDALQKQQRWNETIFVVTADHGEEFLEHGNRYHSPISLREELIRVPLLMHAPGALGPGVLPGPFSLIHLAPTLLDGLEVEIPQSFQGMAYWKEVRAGSLPDSPAIVECVDACNNPLPVSGRIGSRLMAVRDRDYKLVIRFGEQSEDFFDLRHDPREIRPVTGGALVKERVRLLQYGRQHLQRSRERRDAHLALRARFREIRQRIDLTATRPGSTQDRSGIGIADHG